MEFDIPSGNLTQLLKKTIEIVDLPIKNGDFPLLCKRLPEGNCQRNTCYITWFQYRYRYNEDGHGLIFQITEALRAIQGQGLKSCKVQQKITDLYNLLVRSRLLDGQIYLKREVEKCTAHFDVVGVRMRYLS